MNRNYNVIIKRKVLNYYKSTLLKKYYEIITNFVLNSINL